MMIDGTFSTYQEAATKTAVYPGQGTMQGLVYAILGLAGESGETVEQLKKTWRDDGVQSFDQAIDEAFKQAVISSGDLNLDALRVRAKEIVNPPLTEERRQKIIKELGDVFWYAAQICTELGIPMAEVAKLNIRKLAERQQADKLHGEGSDR